MTHPSFRLIEQADGNGHVLFQITEIISAKHRMSGDDKVSNRVHSYGELREEIQANLKKHILEHMKQILIAEGVIRE